MKGKDVHLETIAKAIHNLGSAFSWANSDEGFAYWESVTKKLEAYKAMAFKNESCRTEIAELKKRIEELEQRC